MAERIELLSTPVEAEGNSSDVEEPSDLTDDETLIEDTNPRTATNIVIDDWSQTGRGSHVDFEKEENVPLEHGRFLGRGATGEVIETTVKGWKLAHKRMLIRRNISDKEKKEIEILKRLSSHRHMLQLIGTYTHRQFLGILLYPVAVCDLHTLFEDIEAWSNTKTEPDTKEGRLGVLDNVHKDRLLALNYNFPAPESRHNAVLIYSQIGCLISAISYLHDQKIRHKDIKPSNILLSPGRLWLGDFGSATDFSLLSQSATDNERGTARYFSPEVAAWKPNGRASDIFSLGCVLLEIVVIHERGTLDHIRQNRSRDPSFYGNLGNVDTWCSLLEPIRARRSHLMFEIRRMLMDDPKMRPAAEQLLIRLASYELTEKTDRKRSVFGDCCRRVLVPVQEHESQIQEYRNKIEKQEFQLHHAAIDKNALADRCTSLDRELRSEQDQIIKKCQTDIGDIKQKNQSRQLEMESEILRLLKQIEVYKASESENRSAGSGTPKSTPKGHIETGSSTRDVPPSGVKSFEWRVQPPFVENATVGETQHLERSPLGFLPPGDEPDRYQRPRTPPMLPGRSISAKSGEEFKSPSPGQQLEGKESNWKKLLKRTRNRRQLQQEGWHTQALPTAQYFDEGILRGNLKRLFPKSLYGENNFELSVKDDQWFVKTPTPVSVEQLAAGQPGHPIWTGSF